MFVLFPVSWETVCLTATLVFSLILGDLEKEKRRLQNILATGQEEPKAASPQNVASSTPEVMEERDQYQEGETNWTETVDVL